MATTLEVPLETSTRTLEHGDVLFAAGSTVRQIYRVTSGALFCRLQDRVGRSIISRVVEPGHWVGLESVIGIPARATVEAATRTVVEVVADDTSPTMLAKLLDAAIREAAELECRLRDFGLQAARARAAGVLLERARPQIDGRLVITPQMSRQDLAALAGMTPETFIRILSSLRAKGLVSASGRHISITEPRRLASLAGKDPSATFLS